MAMNKVEVYVCGKRYLLQTQEPADYIKKLAKTIDQRFDELFENDKALTLLDAAVLMAFETMDQSVRAAKGSENIRCQIKAYAEESEKLRKELEIAQKKQKQERDNIEKIKTEMDMLKLRLKLHEQQQEKQESMN